MKITCCWMGTNAILIDTGTEKLLFDPFVELAGGENPNCMEDFLQSGADCILITHGHFDHLLFVPEMMEEGEQTVFCSGTPSETLEKMPDRPAAYAVPGSWPQICARGRFLSGEGVGYDLFIRGG